MGDVIERLQGILLESRPYEIGENRGHEKPHCGDIDHEANLYQILHCGFLLEFLKGFQHRNNISRT